MSLPFDPGCAAEPFLTLCAEAPGPEAYPPDQFRTEWGAIFHRGRLDGSARVLVIGQDPAQHEAVVRRAMVGEAGRRLQGLLARLGIERRYVIVNAFLYSVYGSVKAATRRQPALVAYRHRWFDAVLAGGGVQAVVALGQAADEAWRMYLAAGAPGAAALAYAAVTHPTQPESASGGDRAALADATRRLLRNWSDAVMRLAPAVTDPDVPVTPQPYGAAWADGDRRPIPAFDMPAGLPAWMREQDGWARRSGADALAKRRNLTITVPRGVVG